MAANKPFVFFQLNNDTWGENLSGEDSSVLDVATRLLSQGKDDFFTGEFRKAIEAYDNAIALLRTLDTEKCGRELAVCYMRRAEVNEKLAKFQLMISDATKAIKADRTYAKAYFGRACGYMNEKKYFLALQDAIWACIFDRYRTEAYQELVTELNSRFGKRYLYFILNVDLK